MKKSITGIVSLLLPSFLAVLILKLLGHKIGKKVKIGFSFLFVDKMELADDSEIGHFNYIKIPFLNLKERARIGKLNILKGPFSCVFDTKSLLNHKNKVTRSPKGISYGEAVLHLGELAIITVGHHIDLTRSISFGDFSILAGIRSQMWTHGFYHAEQGKDRIRIDGEIQIGNNVYIGSGCIFNPGVKVGDAVHVGGGSTVSKALLKPGMYVGQALRYIETDYDTVKSKLSKIKDITLKVDAYEKK